MINLAAIGNLTKDAETTQSQNNGNVYNKFRIAVNEGIGQSQNTLFLDVMMKVHNPESNGVLQYLTKGKKVYVSGRISLDAWISQQGQAFPSLTIWTDRLELLSNAEQVQPQTQQRPYQGAPQGYTQQPQPVAPYPQNGQPYQQQQFPPTQQQMYNPQYPPQQGDRKEPF